MSPVYHLSALIVSEFVLLLVFFLCFLISLVLTNICSYISKAPRAGLCLWYELLGRKKADVH